jgi:hypothetical protein
MTAYYYAQKDSSENILGLHYSRFWSRSRDANECFQMLADAENHDFRLINRRIREDGLTASEA